MKPSEETRIARSMIAAQERVRQALCRTAAATPWHLEKAAKVARKPKLLERIVPHLEGDAAKQYLAALPGWIEQTKLQDARCTELWGKRRTDYAVQRDHLIAMLLRYDFSLRSYEKLAREPVLQPASRHEADHDESATRMTADESSELQSKIEADLEILDKARAELVAGHDELVNKLVQKSLGDSTELAEEVTVFARNGLAKAAENFDMRRGHRFATYAQWWIKTAIKEKKSWEK